MPDAGEANSEADWLQWLDAAKSRADMECAVGAWWAWTKRSGYPQGSLGFEVYMLRKDWESAKGSLIRSFGRDLGPHQHLLEFLTAAIARRRTLRS